MAEKYLVRPMKLLARHICFAMCSYASFVCAITYLLFSAFSVAFVAIRGWNQLRGSLPFLATLIGCLLACVLMSARTDCISHGLSRTRTKSYPSNDYFQCFLAAYCFRLASSSSDGRVTETYIGLASALERYSPGARPYWVFSLQQTTSSTHSPPMPPALWLLTLLCEAQWPLAFHYLQTPCFTIWV